MSTLIYSNRFGENYRIYGGESGTNWITRPLCSARNKLVTQTLSRNSLQLGDASN